MQVSLTSVPQQLSFCACMPSCEEHVCSEIVGTGQMPPAWS